MNKALDKRMAYMRRNTGIFDGLFTVFKHLSPRSCVAYGKMNMETLSLIFVVSF